MPACGYGLAISPSWVSSCWPTGAGTAVRSYLLGGSPVRALRMNTEGHGVLYYGYHWWLSRSLLNGRDLAWIAGFGSGGQRLFILPALDLVVVVNAFDHRRSIPLGHPQPICAACRD